MKKAAAILLLCIYSFATMGFSLKEFYCCGKLKSLSLSLGTNGHNYFDKSGNKNDCCKNKFQFHKVKDGHFASPILKNSLSNFYYLSHPCYSYDAHPYFGFQSKAENIHAPPIPSGIDAYIINCVFRI